MFRTDVLFSFSKESRWRHRRRISALLMNFELQKGRERKEALCYFSNRKTTHLKNTTARFFSRQSSTHKDAINLS